MQLFKKFQNFSHHQCVFIVQLLILSLKSVIARTVWTENILLGVLLCSYLNFAALSFERTFKNRYKILRKYWRDVSSAKREILLSLQHSGKHLMYSKKRNGLEIDPRGTPVDIAGEEDFLL